MSGPQGPQGALWRTVWRARWRQGWISLLVVLAFPALVIGALGGAATHSPGRALAWALWALLAVAWLVHQRGLALFNDPRLARTLPGQVRALRLHLLGGGAVACVLFAALLGLAADRPWADVLGLGALYLVAGAWLVQAPIVWVVGWVLLPAGVWVLSPASPALRELLPWPSVLLLLGLFPLVGTGGRWHRFNSGLWGRVRHLERRLGAGRPQDLQGPQGPQDLQDLQGPQAPLAAAVPWLHRLGRRLQGPYWRRWAQLVQAPSPANALERLDLRLSGASSHPATVLWQMGLGLAVVLAVAAALYLTFASERTAGRDWQLHLRELWPISFGLLGGAVGTVSGRLQTLLKGRREQALLVLLPGVPALPVVGAGLQRRWWGHALVIVAAALLGVVVFMAVAWRGVDALSPVAYAVCAYAAAVLWMPLLTLADLSRLQRGPERRLLLGGVLALLLAAGCYAVGASPLWIPALALVGLGAGAAWGWRRSLQTGVQCGAPRGPQLPVGRGLKAATR